MRGKRGVCRVITIALVFVSIAMLTGCSRQASSKIKITQSSTPVIEKTAEATATITVEPTKKPTTVEPTAVATATKAEKPNTTEEDKKNTEPSPTPGVIKPADYVKALEKTYGVKLPESEQVLNFRNFMTWPGEERLQAKVVITTKDVKEFVKSIHFFSKKITEENRIHLILPGTIRHGYVPDWWDLNLDDVSISAIDMYTLEDKYTGYITSGCKDIMITKDFDGKTYIYFA